MSLIFFFAAPAPTEISSLSLHDALPISVVFGPVPVEEGFRFVEEMLAEVGAVPAAQLFAKHVLGHMHARLGEKLRSEEHTSELQSRGHLVCRLLLEKKKITSC